MSQCGRRAARAPSARSSAPTAVARARAVCALLLLHAAPASSSAAIPADAPFVQWTGRTVRPLSSTSYGVGAVAFDWEATSWRVTVTGASALRASLRLQPGDEIKLRVFVDGVDRGAFVVHGAAAPVAVVLASGLDPSTPHAILVVNTVEPMHIYGGSGLGVGAARVPPALLQLSTDGALATPAPQPARTMMVIGDSITAGSGNLGVPPCNGDINTSDVTRAFGALLAANFSAQLLGNIAVSGIGVLANCCDNGPTIASIELSRLGGVLRADADHNNPTRPQLLMVGLGTNDFYKRDPSNATFVDAFVGAYVDFIVDLAVNRLSNGTTAIFLVVGPITNVYGPAVARVVNRTAAMGLPIYLLDLMGAALDGCGSHPGVIGHAQMAAIARPHISAAMHWDNGDVSRGSGDRFSRSGGAALVEAASSVARVRTGAADSAAAAAAAAVERGPDIKFTVRSDGSGDFVSVQAALDFCNATGDASALGHVTLHLLGQFTERVEISSLFPSGVSLIGDGAGPSDAMILFSRAGAHYSTWWSHTVVVGAADVTFVNIALANNASAYDAAVAGQSVALHLEVTSDRFACFGCALFGAQDTLYTGGAGFGVRSYFAATFINGSCDSIFGGSSSVFENVMLDMNTTATAPRGEPTAAYLFLDSSLGGTRTELGRPWGQLSTVVWKNTAMGAGIESAGWDDWEHGCTSGAAPWYCAPMLFAEYNSSGPGADPAGRVKWSRQLSAVEAAEWTAPRVLRGWVPRAGLRADALRAVTVHGL